MSSTLAAALYTLARLMVGSGFFDRAAELVRGMIHSDLPGADKKARVKSFLMAERHVFTGIALDLVIAVTRARFEARAPRPV